MKYDIVDSDGNVAFELHIPDPPEEKLVSEVIVVDDLPYAKLRCGEYIIDGYIARTDRRRYREVVNDRRQRERWARKK